MVILSLRGMTPYLAVTNVANTFPPFDSDFNPLMLGGNKKVTHT